jgi:F-type H+-transporting ATPase subunit b
MNRRVRGGAARSAGLGKPSALALVCFAVLGLLAPSAQAASELVLIPDIWTLVSLIVGFTVLSLIINPLIVQPVLRVIDERRERIEGARERAERVDADANAILARYEASVREVREEAERTRRDHLDAARSEQAQITAGARAEADREIAASRGELANSLEQARATLRSSADALAREVAERILGRVLS